MARAKSFMQINMTNHSLTEIKYSVAARKNVLIVPDKDADGLSAGAILRHTLLLLGVAPELLNVHLLSKGTNIHSETEREKMAAKSPSYIFVIDQGSRPGPRIIDAEHTGLVIDHHHATEDDFPAESEHVSTLKVRLGSIIANGVITGIRMLFSSCSDLSPTYVYNLPTTALRSRRTLRLAVYSGNSWRFGKYDQVEPSFPRYDGSFQEVHKEAAERCHLSGKCTSADCNIRFFVRFRGVV